MKIVKFEQTFTLAIQILMLITLVAVYLLTVVHYAPKSYGTASRDEKNNQKQEVRYCVQGESLRLVDIVGEADRYFYETANSVQTFNSGNDEIIVESSYMTVRGVIYNSNSIKTCMVVLYATPIIEPPPDVPIEVEPPIVSLSVARACTYVGIGLTIDFDVSSNSPSALDIKLILTEGNIDYLPDGSAYFISDSPCVANITLMATDVSGNTAKISQEVTVLQRDETVLFEHSVVVGRALYDAESWHVFGDSKVYVLFLDGDYIFESEQTIVIVDKSGVPFHGKGRVLVSVGESILVTCGSLTYEFEADSTYLEFSGQNKDSWSTLHYRSSTPLLC